eukprot:7981585-Pyramimonas_sp.AAC.1
MPDRGTELTLGKEGSGRKAGEEGRGEAGPLPGGIVDRVGAVSIKRKEAEAGDGEGESEERGARVEVELTLGEEGDAAGGPFPADRDRRVQDEWSGALSAERAEL